MMDKELTALEKDIRQEVLNYLVKQKIDLSDHNAINGALDIFESKIMEQYMKDTGYILQCSFKILDNNDIQMNVVELGYRLQ